MMFKLLYLFCVILIISGCLFNDNSSKQDTPPTEPPLPPSELTADLSEPYAVTLSWNDNADNEDGYLLGFNTHIPANTTEWSLTDLKSPLYRFELIAYNDVGTSKSVWFENIKIKWEYPHIYKINIINAEVYHEIESQTPNGFVCVYEDSVTINFTCTVDGKKRVVAENSKRPVAHLSMTVDNVWFSKYFEYNNYNQNKCSIWAIRVDSMDDIVD